jgi:hypothetical protein
LEVDQSISATTVVIVDFVYSNDFPPIFISGDFNKADEQIVGFPGKLFNINLTENLKLNVSGLLVFYVMMLI